MGPIVVIDVAPPEAVATYEAVLVQSCTQAILEGRCEMRGGPAPDDAMTASIVVDAATLAVRIELVLSADGRATTITRPLAFLPEDQPAERWRAIGLVVGTLASVERERQESGTSPPIEAPVAPPKAPDRVASPAPSPPNDGEAEAGALASGAGADHEPWFWMDAAVVFGPALDDDTWKVGAMLRPWYTLASLPLGFTASIRYQVRPTDSRGVAVEWWSFGGGGGLVLSPLEELSIDVRGEILAELLSASVEDPATSAEDDGDRWAAAARAGADVAWLPTAHWGVLLGVDATFRSRATAVVVGGELQARSAAIDVAPAVGVRFRW